jgi:glycosyltransferase involved in cell wall biosynthesis
VRILHITPYSADAWAYGGIPRIVGTLAAGLARRGHQVTVCATDACDDSHRLAAGTPRRSRLSPWPPQRTTDQVELRIFPNLSNRLAYRCQGFVPLGLGRYLGEHAREFDVAHLHACRNLPGAIGARHLRRAGVPYVLAPNGTAPRIERRQFAKWIFDAAVGRRILNGAARVLVVSDAERRQLTRLGVDPSRIRSIPNPVDLDEFTPPIACGLFRQRFGLGAGPLVMFLGKITPRKRLDVLVRAFARLRSDARLVLAGNDMGAAAGARALVRSLGIEPRTLFTGLLKGRDRLEALADAEVLVYPSQDEIFGLVPLEALLTGTPVIVADDSGCGEVVQGTGGGQVVPLGDADALARAIEVVLTSPADWRAAASIAARRVRLAYAGDVVSAQLEQMYAEMIE